MNWVTYQKEPLKLEESVIDVWRICLPDFFSQKDELVKFISAEELVAAKRFVNEQDGDRYLVAKAFQRTVLSRYLGVDPKNLLFSLGDHGKPCLESSKNCQFNLSHSGDYALLAVTKSCSIGIDIEKMREKIDVMALVDRFFSENEKNVFGRLDLPELKEMFYRCWVKKEAFVKATGHGLSFSLADFTVGVLGNPDEEIVNVHNGKVSSNDWRVVPLSMTDLYDYYAAVSVKGAIDRIICRDYQTL